MNIVPTRIYQLGRFRVIAGPLETNPGWTTHRVYLRDNCIGRQFSAPSLDDCERMTRAAPVPIEPREIDNRRVLPRRTGGRPSREAKARSDAELLTVIPE